MTKTQQQSSSCTARIPGVGTTKKVLPGSLPRLHVIALLVVLTTFLIADSSGTPCFNVAEDYCSQGCCSQLGPFKICGNCPLCPVTMETYANITSNSTYGHLIGLSSSAPSQSFVIAASWSQAKALSDVTITLSMADLSPLPQVPVDVYVTNSLVLDLHGTASLVPIFSGTVTPPTAGGLFGPVSVMIPGTLPAATYHVILYSPQATSKSSILVQFGSTSMGNSTSEFTQPGITVHPALFSNLSSPSLISQLASMPWQAPFSVLGQSNLLAIIIQGTPIPIDGCYTCNGSSNVCNVCGGTQSYLLLDGSCSVQRPVCAPGQYQVQTNQTNSTAICHYCAAGSFSSVNDSSSCFPCPAGSFSPSGFSACISCSHGNYSTGIGSTACIPCDSGLQPNSDKTGCQAVAGSAALSSFSAGLIAIIFCGALTGGLVLAGCCRAFCCTKDEVYRVFHELLLSNYIYDVISDAICIARTFVDIDYARVCVILHGGGTETFSSIHIYCNNLDTQR